MYTISWKTKCLLTKLNRFAYSKQPSPGSSVGSDEGCQSRGCMFEPKLGQHSVRRLTKVTVISVIRLLPMDYQSMWKSSQLPGKYVVWSTGVRKPGDISVGLNGSPWYNCILFENGVKPQSINHSKLSQNGYFVNVYLNVTKRSNH